MYFPRFPVFIGAFSLEVNPPVVLNTNLQCEPVQNQELQRHYDFIHLTF